VNTILTLYHGSDHIITNPTLNGGKVYNDYGRGFYTTENFELAGEWACQSNNDGYVNKYMINTNSLKILDLQSNAYSVLNWIAILLKNRVFNHKGDLASKAHNFILDNYLPDTQPYDVIRGYRADDSYFAYAEGFINNAISVRQLESALKLGKLGIQYALISDKAFNSLSYIDSYPVKSNEYYPMFYRRDTSARRDYGNTIKNSELKLDDIFILDLLRGGGK